MYYTNIQEDFSKNEYTEAERMQHSLKSAFLYNQRLLNFRNETSEWIKKIEESKLGSRFPIDSINSAIHSHQIPLTIQMRNGMVLHDNNEALNPSTNSVDKFIQLNVHSENNKAYNDMPKCGYLYKPQRIIHRRRKRGSLKHSQNM
jgi:hypothetical protein